MDAKEQAAWDAGFEAGVAEQRATVASWLRVLVVFEPNPEVRAKLDLLADTIAEGLHENAQITLSPQAFERMAEVIALEPGPSPALMRDMVLQRRSSEEVLILRSDPPPSLPLPAEELQVDFIPISTSVAQEIERRRVLEQLDELGRRATDELLEKAGMKKVSDSDDDS